MNGVRWAWCAGLILAAGCGESSAPRTSSGDARDALPVVAISGPSEQAPLEVPEGQSEPIASAAVELPQQLEFQGDVLGEMTLEEFQTKYADTDNGVKFPVMPGDSYPGIANYTMSWHKEAGLVVAIPAYRGRPEQWAIGGAPTLSVTYDFLDGVLQGISFFVKDRNIPAVAYELEQQYGKPDVVDSSHVRKWIGPTWMLVVEPDGSITFLDSARTKELAARRESLRTKETAVSLPASDIAPTKP